MMHLPVGPATVAAAVRDAIRGAARIAVADGIGAPYGLTAHLADLPRDDVPEIWTGWHLGDGLSELIARASTVRTYMPGHGLPSSAVRYVPCRFGAIPGLLREHLRPDVLLVRLTERRGRLQLTTEGGWLPAAMQQADRIIAEVDLGRPSAAVELDLDHLPIEIVAYTRTQPPEVAPPSLNQTQRALGHQIASLIPAGATVQFPPGWLGHAVCAALQVPVHVHSGAVGDWLVDLADRGLILGNPTTSYVAGTSRLYHWADGLALADRTERTHDPTVLAGLNLYAVNIALQVDVWGQVVVDRAAQGLVAGVGGQPDFAGAAAASPTGLSIIALPTHRRGRSTLLQQISHPVSTSRVDVDVVVTEQGHVDLRGLDDTEREHALRALWSWP